MTRLPLHFAPLRELADRSADEYAADDTHGAIRVYARIQFTRLLSDLTRPESQAVWLRWLATELGWTESEHTPTWCYRYPRQAARDRDGAPMHEDLPAAWLLMREDGECMAFCPPDPEWMPDGWRAIPGLDMSGPEARTAALVLAVLTAGGGS